MNASSHLLTLRSAGTALMAFCLANAAPVTGQTVDLDFSSPVGSSNGSDSLGNYWTSSVLNFQNVGTVGAVSLDLRVTATAWGSYSFSRHYADYSESVSQPDGDLGLRYISTGNGSGGLSYQLEFFESGSNYTTAYAVPQVKLLIYDIDGESSQSEKLRAYSSDGLFSYQTGTAAASVTAAPVTGGMLFTGPGQNYNEDDPTGALILTYQNTDSILLDFESTTFSGGSGNPVFSAIDGDLSMIGGDESGYTAPAVVPEPSGALLLGIAGVFVILRRRTR